MCNLCIALETERAVFSNELYTILKTKDMKGHKQRIMVLFNSHVHMDEMPIELEEYLIDQFIEFCEKYFKSETFVINEPTYSSIKEHWHIVASDWEGDDIDQIHKTEHHCFLTDIGYERLDKNDS